MQGTRLPDNTPLREIKSGEYSKNTWTGSISWYIRDPLGGGGCLDNHNVVENEDGTITVSPSILDDGPGGYHGFLEKGVWRT